MRRGADAADAEPRLRAVRPREAPEGIRWTPSKAAPFRGIGDHATTIRL